MAKKTKTNLPRLAWLHWWEPSAPCSRGSPPNAPSLRCGQLATQHGTSEQQALKRSEIEREKRDVILALVAEFAVRGHQRKRVHLSELGGWQVCWPDDKRGR